MDKRQLSTAETFTRALWLVDNSLLDARPSIPSDQLKTSLNKRMSALGLGDELSSLRAIDRFLQTPPQLLQVVDELCTRLFELRGGLPMLRQDSLARRLARVIDLDALKCLHPNLKLPSDEKFDWAVGTAA